MYVLPTVSFNGIGMQTGEATQTRKRRNRQSKTLAAGPGPAPRRAADRFRAHAHRRCGCVQWLRMRARSPRRRAGYNRPGRACNRACMHLRSILQSRDLYVAFRRKDPLKPHYFLRTRDPTRSVGDEALWPSSMPSSQPLVLFKIWCARCDLHGHAVREKKRVHTSLIFAPETPQKDPAVKSVEPAERG